MDKPNPKKSNRFKLDETFENNIKDDIELLQVIFYWLVKGAQNFIEKGNKIALDKGRIELSKGNKTIDELLDIFISEKCHTLRQDTEYQNLYDTENKNYTTKEMDKKWEMYKRKLDIDRQILKTRAKKYKYKIKVKDFYELFIKYSVEIGNTIPLEFDLDLKMQKRGYNTAKINNIKYFIDITCKM